MNLRLSGHFYIFGLVFSVLSSLLGVGRQYGVVKNHTYPLTSWSLTEVQVVKFELGFYWNEKGLYCGLYPRITRFPDTGIII